MVHNYFSNHRAEINGKKPVPWGVSFFFFFFKDQKKAVCLDEKFWTGEMVFLFSLTAASLHLGKQLSELYTMIID